MMQDSWIKEFPGAITVCDKNGIILSMNDKAIESFKSEGGEKLIGSNLFDCHPGGAQQIIQELIDNQRTNIYTIEKNGIKKIIYQSPWYENHEFIGLVELAMEIPFEMPHFNRNKK